jgi:hypothetical protein
MYKITTETKINHSISEQTFIDFKKCFECFQISIKVRNIEHFQGYGIPRDEDIESLGFGLMFHAENKDFILTLTKIATGKEMKVKNPFLRTYNGRMENLIHFILTEGAREFLTLNARILPIDNPEAGFVRFFHLNNQVVGIVERSNQFEIVFSRHFETFGEAIAEIEKHFGSSDFEPESEVKKFLTSEQFLQILSLAAISIPAIILLIFSIFLVWKQ